MDPHAGYVSNERNSLAMLAAVNPAALCPPETDERSRQLVLAYSLALAEHTRGQLNNARKQAQVAAAERARMVMPVAMKIPARSVFHTRTFVPLSVCSL